MDEERKEKKKRQSHLDRATLKPDSLTKIDGWLGDIRQQCRGIRISRTQLVNWLVIRHPSDLTRDEQLELRQMFFDDELLGAWVLRDLRDRRAKGENVTYFDVLAEATKDCPPKNPPTRRKRGLKKEALAETALLPAPVVQPPKKDS